MRLPRSSCLAFVAALALSGCSYGDNLLDLATGTTATTNAGAPNTASPSTPSTAASNPQPSVTATALPSGATATAGAAGTTLMGQRLPSLRADVAQFQGNVAHHQADLAATRESLGNNTSSYSNIITGINTRLQAGTTEGNPELVAQWGQAQALLDQMNGSVTHLIGISNEAADDSSLGNYVRDELRAAHGLRGGVDSDRDELKQLEAQTTSSLAQADQLHTAVSGEITRQNASIAGERNSLATLALAIQSGRPNGPSVAGRQVTPAAAVAAAPSGTAPRAGVPSRDSAAPTASRASDRPLVVIRFDQPNVDYEQPLYTAVNRALQRKPSAAFTIQAVAPNASSAAGVAVNTNASRENAAKVLRSLTAMGMPADRLSLSATMSPDIQSGEVRIYVR